MSPNLMNLAEQALLLPIEDRVVLAQQLWESLDEGDIESAIDGVSEAIAIAKERDAELTSGLVQALTHDEVMRMARQAIE